MATLFAPFKVLALSVVAIILALTPMSSLVFWVEGGSEIVYSSPGFKVTYKSSILEALTRSNETRVRIEVRDHAGRPVEFNALLSGPAVEGVVEVGRTSGKGYAVKGIGGYVAEVKKTLKELNADPAISGLGMLILISAIVEEDNKRYFAADAITVPIIPGKAIGKEIIVEAKLKPIIKHEISRETPPSYEPQQSQTTPPSKFNITCWPFGKESHICRYWELVETTYSTSRYALDYVPIAMTLIDSMTGSQTRQIIHLFRVNLTQGTVWRFSLTASLGFLHPDKNAPAFYATGEGFTRDIRRGVSTELIYGISCSLYPAQLGGSFCAHLVGPNDKIDWRESEILDFYGDVLFSTGFLGKLWLSKYRYVEEVYRYGTPSGKKVIIDNGFVVWTAPAFNENDKIRAYWEVDDNPGYPSEDGGWSSAELLLNELKDHYRDKKETETPIYRRLYELLVVRIYNYSQASPDFGVTIPAGALILAILRVLGMMPSLSTIVLGIIASLTIGVIARYDIIEFYTVLGFLRIELLSSRWIEVFYSEIKHYYTIGDVQKIVPLIIFKPRVLS